MVACNVRDTAFNDRYLQENATPDGFGFQTEPVTAASNTRIQFSLFQCCLVVQTDVWGITRFVVNDQRVFCGMRSLHLGFG